jgi:hypothetical protein
VNSDFVGINAISDGIEALDLQAIADQTLDLDTLNLVMGSFVTANEELSKILRRREASSLEPRTPPNRTTVPANPKYSGESTESANSWSSSDSRAEHFTHQFAYQFINASRRVVQRQLGKIHWLTENCNELISRLHPSPPQLILSLHQNMKIKLGIEMINVIDDGGLVLSSSRVDIHKIPPVLSVEVISPFVIS